MPAYPSAKGWGKQETGRFPSFSNSESATLITLARPHALTVARKPPRRTPPSGSPINVSHERAIVSPINIRLKRSGQPTLTRASPKRLLASLKLCSIQPLCQYHEAALFGSSRLVAKYQGSPGCLRRGFLARLLDTFQHRARLIRNSRGRPW